jgi:hypothetical protein
LFSQIIERRVLGDRPKPGREFKVFLKTLRLHEDVLSQLFRRIGIGNLFRYEAKNRLFETLMQCFEGLNISLFELPVERFI